MINLKDINPKVKLMKGQYGIANALLDRIQKHADTNIDNVDQEDIEDVFMFLQSQNLVEFRNKTVDISIPTYRIPRLSFEGKEARELGIGRFIRRKKAQRLFSMFLLALLILSCLSSISLTAFTFLK